jgi:hypothetical protein
MAGLQYESFKVTPFLAAIGLLFSPRRAASPPPTPPCGRTHQCPPFSLPRKIQDILIIVNNKKYYLTPKFNGYLMGI